VSKRARIAFLLLGLAIFCYLVWSFGFDTIVLNVQRTGWWFLPVIGIWFVVYLFNAWAWYIILSDSAEKVSFGTMLTLTISGFAINYITPFLNLGGEPYRVLSLRESVGLHRAVSSVILYNMVRMLSHFFFWIAAVVLFVLTAHVSLGFGILLGCVSVVVLGLTYFFLSRHRKGIFESLLSWMSRYRFFQRLASKLDARRGGLLKIDKQIMQLYNHRRGSFYKVVTLEFLSRVIASAEFYFILHAVGYDTSFLEAIYINAASSLILNMLFFIPFELGTREGGLYIIMQSLGYISGIGIYVGLVNRVRELFWIFVGLLLIPWTGRQQVRGSMLEMIEADSGS
jgi:uncharacterized protein (TIRG00374 family)